MSPLLPWPQFSVGWQVPRSCGVVNPRNGTLGCHQEALVDWATFPKQNQSCQLCHCTKSCTGESEKMTSFQELFVWSVRKITVTYKKHIGTGGEREIDWIGLIERLPNLTSFWATFLLLKNRPGDHRLPRLITATGHLPKGVSICSATFISKLLGLFTFSDSWMVWLPWFLSRIELLFVCFFISNLIYDSHDAFRWSKLGLWFFLDSPCQVWCAQISFEA